MGCCIGKKEEPLAQKETSETNELIKKIKDQSDFEQTLNEATEKGKVVVVDFYAPWCGPCQVMHPILNSFATEFQEKVLFIKINCDEAEELTSKYGISSMPTFIFFKDGEKVKEMTGANGEKVKEIIEKLTA